MQSSARVGVRHYRHLIAWQLADSFKRRVFELVQASDAASRDVRYRSQLIDAAGGVSKNIAEGFLRYSRRDFARFLDYALGSLAEAEGRVADGIELGHFTAESCQEALRLARRCLVATIRLKQSQLHRDD